MDNEDLRKEIPEDMEALNYQVWQLLEPYTRTQDGVLMASAVLLKIAIQMYSVVSNDEDIAGMLSHEAIESIPTLRRQLQKNLKLSIH